MRSFAVPRPHIYSHGKGQRNTIPDQNALMRLFAWRGTTHYCNGGLDKGARQLYITDTLPSQVGQHVCCHHNPPEQTNRDAEREKDVMADYVGQ